jgi:hypothetical protein
MERNHDLKAQIEAAIEAHEPVARQVLRSLIARAAEMSMQVTGLKSTTRDEGSAHVELSIAISGSEAPSDQYFQLGYCERLADRNGTFVFGLYPAEQHTLFTLARYARDMGAMIESLTIQMTHDDFGRAVIGMVV